MKGRARDRAALDYVCGAARTVELVGEQTNDAVTRGNMLESYRVLELLAFLASTRGYLAVEEHSKQGA
jgi:hypothetical protein